MACRVKREGPDGVLVNLDIDTSNKIAREAMYKSTQSLQRYDSTFQEGVKQDDLRKCLSIWYQKANIATDLVLSSKAADQPATKEEWKRMVAQLKTSSRSSNHWTYENDRAPAFLIRSPTREERDTEAAELLGVAATQITDTQIQTLTNARTVPGTGAELNVQTKDQANTQANAQEKSKTDSVTDPDPTVQMYVKWTEEGRERSSLPEHRIWM